MSRILQFSSIKTPWAVILVALFLVGCRPSSNLVTTPTGAPTETATLLPSATATGTSTLTPTPSETPTSTMSPTPTPTPSVTMPPSQAPTPTPSDPQATVLEQANCRYGPGTAYLYSHGLYAGDRGLVHGRNYSGTWLWILPENLERHCWVAASVVEVTGEVKSVNIVQSRLPHTTFVGPPAAVQADRDGDEVTVYWSAVHVKPPEDSRGYLLEVVVCRNGSHIPLAVHTTKNQYTFVDEQTCGGGSGGRVYAVEKHGYTDPVEIPWP